MSESTRRKFLQDVTVGLGTASIAGTSTISTVGASMASIATESEFPSLENQSPSTAIDFRYSPLSWQTAYCYPDDPHKSLIGEHGELRYGHPGQGGGIAYFPEVVEFSLLGMETNQVSWQRLEAPGVPIIHTRLDRPEAFLHITTFATRREGEGRVDNVILEIEPRTAHSLAVVPLVILETKREVKVHATPEATILHLDNEKAPPFLISNVPFSQPQVGGGSSGRTQFKPPWQPRADRSAASCAFRRKVRTLTS